MLNQGYLWNQRRLTCRLLCSSAKDKRTGHEVESARLQPKVVSMRGRTPSLRPPRRIQTGWEGQKNRLNPLLSRARIAICVSLVQEERRSPEAAVKAGLCRLREKLQLGVDSKLCLEACLATAKCQQRTTNSGPTLYFRRDCGQVFEGDTGSNHYVTAQQCQTVVSLISTI